MKKIKSFKLIHCAYLGLIISILSTFTTIVGYTNSLGIHKTFSIIDFLIDSEGFGSFIFTEYKGQVIIQYESWQLFVLIALGTVAIICAITGLVKLSKQTDNKASFILTILGLIITMAPSVILFIECTVLKDQYLGTISCGIYPIVSPIAMIICMVAATEMHRRNNKYRKKLKEAEGLIFRGGDL